jgi:hypothetical protein
MPGDHFQYMSVIFNAKAGAHSMPDLVSRLVLYREGSEIFKSEPRPLNISNSINSIRIPIKGKLTLGKNLQEGDYVMQLVVTDKRRKKKDGLASQTLSFKIVSQ